MDQNGVALHFVNNQIVVNDKNAIPKRSEFGSLRNTTDERGDVRVCNRASR
jgi:hypothetical protein